MGTQSHLLQSDIAQRISGAKTYSDPAKLLVAGQRVKTHFLVKDRDLLTPAALTPAEGDHYLMPASGTIAAAWATAGLLNGEIAAYTNAAWLRITPALGDVVAIEDESGLSLQWGGAAWLLASDAVIPNARTVSILTIDGGTPGAGVVVPTQSTHIIAAASGTADDLVTVTTTNFKAGDTIKISPDTGDTITVKASGGNITTEDDSDITLADVTQYCFLHVTATGVVASRNGTAPTTSVYATRTAAAAASIGAATNQVITQGYTSAADHGGATYRRVPTPAPVKAWHFQSADGAYWEIDERTWTPEMVGAVGDGTAGAAGSGTDNTTAFTEIAAAIATASLRISKVLFKRDAVYWALPNGTTNGFILFNLTGINGVEFDGSNCLISLRFSDVNIRVTCFFLATNASYNNIHNFRLEQPNRPFSDILGTDWSRFQTGASFNKFQAVITLGLEGAVFIRLADGDARCEHNEIIIKTTDCAYGIAHQSQGDHNKIRADVSGAHRSLISYNCRGNDWRIIVDKPVSNQILITSYGGTNVTDDIKHNIDWDLWVSFPSITFINQPPTAIVFHHNQRPEASNSANEPTKIRGRLHLDMDLGTDVNRYAQLILSESFIWTTLSPPATLILGEPSSGSNTQDITISGSVTGNVVGASDSMDLGTAAHGFGANAKLNLTLQNFVARNLAQPIAIGRYQNLNAISCDVPLASLNFAAPYSGRFNNVASNFSDSDYDIAAQFTPVWDADTTSPAIGNGSLSGWITNIGRMVLVQITLSVGSTTTFGVGDWYFTLPAPYDGWAPRGSAYGNCRVFDSGTGFYGGVCRFSSVDRRIRPYNGAFAANGIRSNTPMTWATSDSLELSVLFNRT